MATKYGGYMGKVMLIDLTTESVSEYPWTDEQRELYLGGKIMAARILCDHLTGKETAFSEENWVVISTGPLTGTGAPSSARFNISALSPQTGILASSNCGGSFGFHLKKAGYDALILKGKCQGHKWLEINEEQFAFHDAGDLWGTKVSECQEKLAQLTDAVQNVVVYVTCLIDGEEITTRQIVKVEKHLAGSSRAIRRATT